MHLRQRNRVAMAAPFLTVSSGTLQVRHDAEAGYRSAAHLRRFMKLLRRVLILAHRYLGIGIGLLVIMWFATGIVMMYAGGMPRLTPQLRIERLAALDPSRVRLTPAEAAERADASGGRTLLLSVMDRPAYRFGGTTVFADTGEILPELTAPQARTVASRFMHLPEDRVEYVSTITSSDQCFEG